MLLDLEHELGTIDPASWLVLRDKLARYVHRPDISGHSQLFDHFHEAKGYRCLHQIGAGGLHFVREEKGRRTPDLRGVLNLSAVAMEVKTIRESTTVERYLATPASERSMLRGVAEPSEGLKGKITSTLASGAAQLAAESGRRLIYLVIRLDFNFHGRSSVQQHIDDNRPPGIESIHVAWLGEHWETQRWTPEHRPIRGGESDGQDPYRDLDRPRGPRRAGQTRGVRLHANGDGHQERKIASAWLTEADALEALAKRQREVGVGQLERVDRTLGEVAEEYLRYKGEYGKRTVASDRRILDGRLLPALGSGRSIRTLTGSVIAQYEKNRMGTKAKGRRSTI